MKMLLAAVFFTTLSIHAQVGTSPRNLTKRIEPQLQRPAPATRPAAPAQVGVATPAAKAPLTAAEFEQKKAMESVEEKKKLQWQMERAEKGSDPAQFALLQRLIRHPDRPNPPVLASMALPTLT